MKLGDVIGHEDYVESALRRGNPCQVWGSPPEALPCRDLLKIQHIGRAL